MTETKKNRYKQAQGKHLIEVRVKNPNQLFDARDPAPFRERDLDDDFAQYVVSSAREFSLAIPLKLVLYLEESHPDYLTKEIITESIREFFIYQLEMQRRELNTFIKRTQVVFLVGILTLAVFLTLAQMIPHGVQSAVLSILREGLVIFGWVSIWKPIELILFDWYPLWQQIKLYQKLATLEIDVKFEKKEKSV
jgi:hypothetical protein